MSSIPQVNLNDYLSGNSKKKEKFIKDLGKGFSEIGFVAVKGHLLNDVVKDSLYKEVKQFFNLPDSVKSCLLYTSPSPRDLSTSRMPSSA